MFEVITSWGIILQEAGEIEAWVSHKFQWNCPLSNDATNNKQNNFKHKGRFYLKTIL